MDLAKLELKADAKKAAIGSAMFSAAGVLGGLVVILLSIAFAYGLVGFGLWHWAAFLIVAAGGCAAGAGCGLGKVTCRLELIRSPPAPSEPPQCRSASLSKERT
jgi:hypothetical protein